jgi:hypothetical protein
MSQVCTVGSQMEHHRSRDEHHRPGRTALASVAKSSRIYCKTKQRTVRVKTPGVQWRARWIDWSSSEEDEHLQDMPNS